MVEIISKKDGLRREDAQVKRLIEENRPTIGRIADQISGGGYTALRTPRQTPKAEGLIFHFGGGAAAAEVSLQIRVSLNGRVIAVDRNSGRQIHHIGDIRFRDGGQVFVLATSENGFFAPVDRKVSAVIADMDGVRLNSTYDEDQLAAEIGSRLCVE